MQTVPPLASAAVAHSSGNVDKDITMFSSPESNHLQSHKEEHGIRRSERQKKYSAESVEIAGTTGESVDTARTTSKPVCKSVDTARSSHKSVDTTGTTSKSVDTTRDTSKSVDTAASTSKSVDTAVTSQGLKFKRKQTFVGKRIQHEWVVNEDTGEKQWYNGTVLRIVKGNCCV
ncbi:uncharacterized protein LOC123531005 [Mercenaria mercenaria]|uniref:uncharacterized protein LOC123531005 n=1 Tax=Mercenaria mercenaria TaxID=6596 RepID=UPI00234F2CAC|nr:uncharacterized protein LOC123531005 [Mercenaria mercenaria]